jgi:hypothetical protein
VLKCGAVTVTPSLYAPLSDRWARAFCPAGLEIRLGFHCVLLSKNNLEGALGVPGFAGCKCQYLKSPPLADPIRKDSRQSERIVARRKQFFSRLDLHRALKDGGRGAGSGPRSQRLSAALVVMEMALGPGIVQRFRSSGIRVNTAERVLITRVTSSTNCMALDCRPVMAAYVRQRDREIGVRMAPGAKLSLPPRPSGEQ